MAIGSLRHIAFIVRRTYRSDGAGGQELDTESRRMVYAGVKTNSGTEAIADGAVTNAKTATLVIRNTDIRASDFIVYNRLLWNITDIEPVNGKPFYLYVYIRRQEVTGA